MKAAPGPPLAATQPLEELWAPRAPPSRWRRRLGCADAAWASRPHLTGRVPEEWFP